MEGEDRRKKGKSGLWARSGVEGSDPPVGSVDNTRQLQPQRELGIWPGMERTILATAEVSARLLLAALRPRLRSEELHPHCPPIHVVAVKRVHSGLRARLLLEHHETETALEDGGREVGRTGG